MAPVPAPWKHQIETIDFLDDRPDANDFSDAGTGKTRGQLDSFKRQRGASRLLVLCPKTLMYSAWGLDIEKFTPDLTYSLAYAECREEAFNYDTDVVITNVDAATWLADKSRAKLLRGFTDCVVDESSCFVAGTLVDTPTGLRAIETLHIGDLVFTSSGILPVTSTYQRVSSNLVLVELEDGTKIRCTADHPFATDNGWREAWEVGDMSVVRLDVRSESDARATLLQQELFSQSNVDAQREEGKKVNKSTRIRNAFTQALHCLEQGAKLASRVQATIKRSCEATRSATEAAWWQWKNRALRAACQKNASSLLGFQSFNTYAQKTIGGLSILLQSGFRQREDENGYRNRRKLTHCAKALGCEEGRLVGLTRVARISRVECFGEIKVFNLRVDGPHDYSVSGVLVHNCYKHPTTKRSKALVALRKHFKRHRCMTATPNPISVTELWNPMMFVDGGKRLGNSYYHMRNIMQVPCQVGPGINHIRWDDRPGAAQAVDDLIADITIRHDFAKVMSHIPLNERSKRQFELSPKARKLYTTMENDCVVALKDSTVTAVHAAALRTKLLQMASGAVYNGNEEGSYSLIDTGRYELIADLIDVRKHSLVFFNWRHQRDELAKEFSNRGYSFAIIDGNVPQRERDRIVSDFQAGVYKVILLHPRTGAHGLTLTRATTTIIASPIYEADLLKQAIHRTYRGGQENETETILIEALGTVEAKVYERLFEKEARMTDLLTLIQNRRKA